VTWGEREYKICHELFEWTLALILLGKNYAAENIMTDSKYLFCFCCCLAAGEEFTVGVNGCLQSYHIQMHRMNEEGQIIHDDFCFTLTEAKAGALVRSAT
jgi:hypothetical protein